MGKKNIVLIGMPGAGKSTAGVLLAKTLGMTFFDTDLLIQKKEGRFLQDIINSEGLDKFMAIEERAVLELSTEGSVIATGGSVVYSSEAIAHLKENSVIVYLKHGLYKIEQRIGNAETRGLAMKPGQSLSDLFKERTPLYERYADVTVNCSGKHMEVLIKDISKKVTPLLNHL